MYSQAQEDELTAFIEARFTAMGKHLSEPMEAGDSAFVTADLPAWLGQGMEYILHVRWTADENGEDGTFLMSMDIHFGDYYRRMELVSGDLEVMRGFAKPDHKCRQISQAIFELMALERG